MAITQNHVINIQPGVSAPLVIHCSQGDTGTQINLTVVNGDEEFDCSSYACSVHGTRSDRANWGPVTCNVSGSTVSFSLTSEMTAVAGSCLAEVSIGTVRTANFALLVENATFENGVTYSNDVSVYQNILNAVQAGLSLAEAAVTNEKNERIAAINAEAAARQNADNTLQGNINSEASTRAAADAVLQGQIDNFVHLPSGSTAADAELVNIRVKADGTSAATAGNAVREQFTELKNDLDESTLYAAYNWEVGRIISDDGTDGYNAKTYRTKGYYSTAAVDYVEINKPTIDSAMIWYYSDNAGTFANVRGYLGGRNPSKVAINKDYPYYRITFNQQSFSALPSLDDIWAYKITNYRKATDARLDVLETNSNIVTSVATRGYYQLDASHFARGRWYFNQDAHQPRQAGASYRICIPYVLTLDYDIQIVCNDPNFSIYGWRYISDYGWRYFDSNSGIPIIPSGMQFCLTICRPKATEDTSETADIALFASKAEFVTGFVTEYGRSIDALRKSIDSYHYPATEILTANDDAVNKIWASRWLRSSTAKPLTFLWFSDIHRWETPLKRIIEFKNYLNSLGILDDTICTGDLVRNSTDEATAFESFWNDTPGTDDILIALGNHDHYDVGPQPHGKATFAKMDSMFFKTVSDWNVVRESNYPYYYKDYTEQGIRLIVADPAVTSDEADETTWLQNTLAGAKTAGYAVVVASHFLVTESASIYDNDWSNNLARETGSDSMSYDWNGCDIVGCVTDFIANGGNFICYMIGHTHTDIISYVTGHPDQLIINVASASDDRSHETPLTTNDLPRYDNSRTQDCFNVITFDAVNGIIKCVRVGANINMYQQPRTAFSYNVNTHEFINLI